MKRDDVKAARLGEPSYVWRTGQERRLNMILEAAADRIQHAILDSGCGVGMYVAHLAPYARRIVGLEYDFERAAQAGQLMTGGANIAILSAAGENLPFPDNSFSLILSHEVLEHVNDDARALQEMVRVLCPAGRLVIFVPNRGYPFETHGVYWRGRYIFGNIPLVNYLPLRYRNRLAPHVRIYSRGTLERLFNDLPVRVVSSTQIFGAYDNVIARNATIGKMLRALLQALEKTPARCFGLSHFYVLEKISQTGVDSTG